MTRMKVALGAAALCTAFIGTAATAMPVAPVAPTSAANVEQVRWVCGPYRCWWRPNYYYRGYYGYGYYPRHRWYWRHHRRW